MQNTPGTKAAISSPPASGSVRRWLTGLTGFSVVIGLLASTVPPALSFPFSEFSSEIPFTRPGNKYDNCAEDLIEAGVSAEIAAVSCARAFSPGKLGECTTRIARDTGIPGLNALAACSQVRRPEETAECVSDIRREVSGADAPGVVDNCRRSLLPERYSECVVGLSKEVELPPNQILDTCIRVGALPQELDPTFIPYPAPPSDAFPPPIPPLTPEVVPQPQATPIPEPTAPAPATQPIPQRF